MQTRSSNEISVCLSVRPSVKRVDCDNTKEKSVQIFIPCERTFPLVLWEKEWLVGATHSTWNFGSTGPHWSKIADFEPIIARSAAAKKSSINTNRKSPTHFPTSLRRSPYVAPNSPKRGSETQISGFPSKSALLLKKVCYKVSLCENCQRQSCRAFIGLTIHAKIIGGGRPFHLKFWVKVTKLGRNCRFSIYFRM